MDLTKDITVGLKAEQAYLVGEEDTATRIGSGGLEVLATPMLIAFMERVAYNLLEERLPEGFSSVGVLVDVRHLAATPVGKTVWAVCEVIEVEGRRVRFAVEAWEAAGLQRGASEQRGEKIGEGVHERVIIDKGRFLQRLKAKG
jgi:fluoroacetyl-CoA thioesterase